MPSISLFAGFVSLSFPPLFLIIVLDSCCPLLIDLASRSESLSIVLDVTFSFFFFCFFFILLNKCVLHVHPERELCKSLRCNGIYIRFFVFLFHFF